MYKQIFIILLLITSVIFSQDFKVASLVDIPGDNLEFDVLTPNNDYPSLETYLCWINKLDSNYTVYLKQLSPTVSDNIIISSDTRIKSNPQIAENRYNLGIKIAWQVRDDSFWSVNTVDIKDEQQNNFIPLLDSLKSDPQITLSMHRLAWIQDSSLFFMEFYPELSEAILVDINNCSSPDINKYDHLSSTQILYEKNIHDSIKAAYIEYSKNREKPFNKRILSSSALNRNPTFGLSYNIAFQAFEDNVWRIKYSEFLATEIQTTKNLNCNFMNPFLFTYPVPTAKISNNTETKFFLAFDSDSLENNREIFIQSFYFSPLDSVRNVSNLEGDDYEPTVCYISSNDTIYVAIIWKHYENSKTDFWIAKSIYNPIISDVKDEIEFVNNFSLSQNYPNPFNPVTTINYTIPVEDANFASSTKLIVYDILGNEIKTLVNEQQLPGKYSVEFDGANFASGVYFYRLQVGDFSATKKLMLLK